MKTLLALAALLIVPAASAQSVVVDCGPLSGTIAVAHDAHVSPDMARVSEADARAVTLAAFPGATITDVDLEEEDGFLIYEAEFTLDGVEHETKIDAGSGAILCAERD